jgi:tRNA 2-thiouridine synthesizing protein B
MTKKILYTLNKSAFGDPSLASCLRIALAGSSILLIENGVYAALPSSPIPIDSKKYKIYALDADLKARGLNHKIKPDITVIDYAGFVQLSIDHDQVQAW